VEPAYLEPDSSWCAPGGEPASPLGNGGAFGGKAASIAPEVARRLADEHGRTVRVLLSREDVVRMGPKRPPVAAGVRADGTGVMRVVRTPALSVPGFALDEVDVLGPPTSASIRGAGWAEAAILQAGLRGDATVVGPSGGRASATIDDRGAVHVGVACGVPLDEVVLRSYCVGATHMGLSWVRSEGIAVDDDGVAQDLTIRSFGILRAKDTPEITVEIDDDGGPAVNGSDAVFAAVAAAAWMRAGCPQDWPIERGRSM
jgi:hypothetical protein